MPAVAGWFRAAHEFNAHTMHSCKQSQSATEIIEIGSQIMQLQHSARFRFKRGIIINSTCRKLSMLDGLEDTGINGKYANDHNLLLPKQINKKRSSSLVVTI